MQRLRVAYNFGAEFYQAWEKPEFFQVFWNKTRFRSFFKGKWRNLILNCFYCIMQNQ